MDISKIKNLIELLGDSDVSEIEISEGKDSVRITRAGHTATVTTATVPVHSPQPVPVAPLATPLPFTEPNNDIPVGKFILSPMVGTFYSASSPEAPAFVKVGQQVKIGDPVCIIEAMKMFNKVESEVEGKIKTILVSDGDPIEFDQPLFEVE